MAEFYHCGKGLNSGLQSLHCCLIIKYLQYRELASCHPGERRGKQGKLIWPTELSCCDGTLRLREGERCRHKTSENNKMLFWRNPGESYIFLMSIWGKYYFQQEGSDPPLPEHHAVDAGDVPLHPPGGQQWGGTQVRGQEGPERLRGWFMVGVKDERRVGVEKLRQEENHAVRVADLLRGRGRSHLQLWPESLECSEHFCLCLQARFHLSL